MSDVGATRLRFARGVRSPSPSVSPSSTSTPGLAACAMIVRIALSMTRDRYAGVRGT